MPKFTRRRMYAILGALTLLSLGGLSRHLLQTDDEPIGNKLTRVRDALTTNPGWRRIWNNSGERFLDRIGWRRREVTSSVLLTTTFFIDVGDPDESLRPGLLTTYRDSTAEIVGIEPTIALALRSDETPHPQLRVDRESIHWDGSINILRPGTYQFSAMVRGKFGLKIAGKEVLAADVKEGAAALQQGDEIELKEGVRRLEATFTRYPGIARIELFWQAPHFQKEPLPFSQLGHLPTQIPAALAKSESIERGRSLVEEHNCTRCHRPDTSDKLGRGLQSRQAPDLSRVGRRVYAGWLYNWLASPQKVRPGASMPRLFGDDAGGAVERYAVTRYLTSLGGPLKAPTRQPKADDLRASIERGKRIFAGVGCLACHSVNDSTAVPRKRAHGASAVNAMDRIASSNVPLQGIGSKTTPERLAAFLADPLAIDPSGRMPNMRLNDAEARDLARTLCQSVDPEIKRDLPVAPARDLLVAVFRRIEPRPDQLDEFQRLSADAQVMDLGKRLVIEKGCNNCHTIAPDGKVFANMTASASFDDIKLPGVQTKGCLALRGDPQARSPAFAFTEDDRQAIRLFLRDGTTGSGTAAPAYAARVALKRLNCLACHARDGAGGLSAALTEELRRVERAENSEAITPPPLTDVGHKLRTPWLRQVLTQGARARPWMGLRMPQFGEVNVGWLPEALAAIEGAEPDGAIHKEKLTTERITAGRRLAGKGGFGCISCHDIAGIPNRGTRGPDLAAMDERVRYDWYRRWLEQAQRMQPGTRMPTVFTDGKSLVTQLFGGAADAQAQALWAYFSLGKNLPLPDGLEPPKGLILTVKDTPIMVRTFMPQISPHAMAIGYPGGVSIAYDMAACRLAYAWAGNFLDAAPVWNDRGGNPARVLGPRFWTAPAGFPWALHNSNEAPDFTAQAHDPAFGADLPEGQVYSGPQRLRFKGYSVAKRGAPSMHYRVELGGDRTLEVTEQVQPLHDALAAGLSRRFTVSIPAHDTAWLLAGQTRGTPRILDKTNSNSTNDWLTGRVDVEATGRTLLLPQEGGRLTLLLLRSAPEGARWLLQRSDGQWQAILRLAAEEKLTSDVAIDVWILPRDEPALWHDFIQSRR